MEEWARETPYSLDPLSTQALIYTDAESNGNIATVIVTKGAILCYYGTIPGRLRKVLRYRKTNIVAYELLAAIMGILQFKQLNLTEVGGLHFVDSNPARQCLVRASSRQPDLNQLAGMVWYVAGSTVKTYWCDYVPSKANLADAPSRGDFQIMKQLGARIELTDFSVCLVAVESWMSTMDVSALFV